MGPGYGGTWEGAQDPATRLEGAQGLQVAVVSSADILAQPGVPLRAAYWATRLPGEDWTAWRMRQQAEELEAKAASHLATARRLQGQAAFLRGQADMVFGPELASDLLAMATTPPRATPRHRPPCGRLLPAWRGSPMGTSCGIHGDDTSSGRCATCRPEHRDYGRCQGPGGC